MVIMKTKVVKNDFIGWCLNFLLLKNRFSEKRIFCHRNIFFLFASLFTLSFIVGLCLHCFIHYWKQCFNNYMTGVISKLKRNLNWIWVFSAVPHPAMFYYCLNSRDNQKNNIFSMYILWQNLINQISMRQIFFSKCIRYLIFWTLSLQMTLQILVSLKHQFTNFKKWYSKKKSRCCIVRYFTRFSLDSTRGSQHPPYPRCKGNLLSCLVTSFDCPWCPE